jgi:uncharacterized protein (DUF302 family)
LNGQCPQAFLRALPFIYHTGHTTALIDIINNHIDTTTYSLDTLQFHQKRKDMPSITSNTVKHCRIRLGSPFDAFTSSLETLLHHLEVEYADDIAADPRKVDNHLKALEGSTGLLIFNIQNHGALLNMAGRPQKAKQYVIGNPRVAVRMTVHDIRAALYAPLRIVVYEDSEGVAIVEYDLPSSLFGQFGNEAVSAVAKELDDKLLNAITLADKAR